MTISKSPWVRVPLVIAVGVMLYFRPTREFLKLTFMLGIPFVFILGFMVKKPRYSLIWNICALLLLLVVGVFGYRLIHLPERVQEREIVSSGAALVAEGKYDEAIAKFEKLDDLGKPILMKEKIEGAQKEKAAHQQLEQARQLIAEGNKEEARKIIDAIPSGTRAAQEARELKKSLE